MSAPAPSATHPSAGPSSTPSRFARPATEEQLRRTASALEQNGMTALIATDRAEAVRWVLERIPKGSTVLDAPSQTIIALGIPEAILAAGHTPLRPELTRLRQENKLVEMRHAGASPDVVVGSIHALTEKGQAVIASATGSQLGPYSFGAGKVIWVVGAQKIVPDLDAAFARVHEYALPLESERAMKAYGRPSAVAKLLVVNREFQPDRVTVILLREALGF